MVVSAAAGFLVAFVIADAGGNSGPAPPTTQTRSDSFTDPAAGAVALRFTARPAALKVPHRPRKRHRAKHAAVVAAPATTTTTPVPASTAPAVTPSPRPARPRHQGGTGTGTTTIG
jgi:hypothetical protein